MEILPEHCLSCAHRLDVYMALLNTLEQFFDLTPDEDDRVDALVIHGIAVELLKEWASSTKATTCWPVL